ncbi:hypothetical protein XU06_30350 (plasmid) [Rhodococcus erythropolis]|uniref:cupin domain-containing protein n=1 Tax=Rhodococcus erythropolis TaxID=1833 RepID=UPI00061B8909|nr:cupin domain-containing protein [Rhodococcus erythropolis]AKE01228.1 hypothetical protein XU06_30350 [Rhodococcus erythropolis]
MTVRRIVTGFRDGRPVVLSDGPAPTEHHYKATPGMMTSILWAAEADPRSTVEEAAPRGVATHPEPGHSRFLVVDFPPDAVLMHPDFDGALAGVEQLTHLIGFAERFELDNPGMHQTATVDYAIVIKGPVWLDLDDGAPLELNTGDTVVQQRTRHAWRNKGTHSARLGFVLIGSSQSG